MKHCKHCDIDVKTKRKTCPLCLNVLDDTKDYDKSFQQYPKKQPRPKMNVLVKFALFLSVISIIASFIVNYITFKYYANYWSILVGVAIPYLWLLIVYVITGRGLLTTRVLSAGITTTLLIILVEITVCFVRKNESRELYWSINYVMPFMIMATILALVIICLFRKDLYIDTIIMLFLLAFLSFIGLILEFTTSLIVIEWPTISCAISGIALIIGLFVFTFKDVTEELKKRFHIR